MWCCSSIYTSLPNSLRCIFVGGLKLPHAKRTVEVMFRCDDFVNVWSINFPIFWQTIITIVVTMSFLSNNVASLFELSMYLLRELLKWFCSSSSPQGATLLENQYNECSLDTSLALNALTLPTD